MSNGIQFDDQNDENKSSSTVETRSEDRGTRREERTSRRDDRDRDEDREQQPRRTLNRMLSRGIGRNGASESLAKAFDQFKTYIEEYPSDSDEALDVSNYQILRVERSEHRLDLSSLVFVQTLEDAGEKRAFFYTLLLSGSNTNLPPLRDSEKRGRRRGRDRDRERGEIPRTPGDVYDQTYADTVYDLVSKKFPDYLLTESGSHYLSAGINLEKDRSALENHVFYINAAIETQALAKTGEQDPFSLNWLTEDDSLVVNMEWNGEQLQDANQEPVRTDVLIESSANLDDDDDRVYNENLTKTGGYFELVYSPAEEQGGFRRGRRRNRDDEETQLVTPKFVMSTLDTNFKAITRELLLLGMGTTAPLSDDLTWTRAYTDPQHGDGVNYKDIGSLNYLVNDQTGKYFDVHAPSITEREMMEYFGTLCRPDLAYALDVPESGELVWAHEDFVAAAEGDKDALERIMKSCDDLFDNQFGSIFRDLVDDNNGDKNPFILGDRIINGWYRDGRESEKRDLRNVDMLWWLNRTGDKDSGDDALDWAATFDNTDEDESVLIEKRIRMLQQVLGHSNVHVTGYSRQVLIDITFIEALAKAAAECEVYIQAAVNQTVGEGRRGRGNRRIIQLAGSDAGSKMFSNRNRRRNRDDDDDGDRRSRRRRRNR